MGTAAVVSLVLGAGLAVVPGGLTGESRAAAKVRAWSDAAQPERFPTAGDRRLTVVTANIWKANPRPAGDVARLLALAPDVVGLNEARGLRAHLRTVPGYRLVLPAGGIAGTSNPILLRQETTRFLGSGSELMCDAVGLAPQRWAVYALFEHRGIRVAYVNTHMNSHVDNGGDPFPLPRVTRYVEHAQRLTALVLGLRARDYDVIVGGDLNWAWTAASDQWPHAPAAVFGRLGLETNWAQPGAPAGGTFEDRRIDYLAHDPARWQVVRQRLVRGHSDHTWPVVTYRHRTESAHPPRMARNEGGD